MRQTAGAFGSKLVAVPFTSTMRMSHSIACTHTNFQRRMDRQLASRYSKRRILSIESRLRRVGVIVESEDIHREAYNAAFAHFKACIPGQQGNIEWSEEFYDELQNKVGGGKAKMRWFFGEHGWPASTEYQDPPQSEEQQAALIDALQDWKSLKYQEIIGADAEARPGVMRLIDEARQAGIKVAVCSAATKSSVIHVVKSLLGDERFEALDCFLAGDDVPAKKPDPSIYTLAAERLGVQPTECLVVEDSAIGLQAAVDAGMRCVITYTNSSKTQGFKGAELIVGNLNANSHSVSIEGLLQAKELFDDRTVAAT